MDGMIYYTLVVPFKQAAATGIMLLFWLVKGVLKMIFWIIRKSWNAYKQHRQLKQMENRI